MQAPRPSAIPFYMVYATPRGRVCICRTNANIKKRPGADAPNRQMGVGKAFPSKKQAAELHGNSGSRLPLFFHKELIQPHTGSDPDLFIDGCNVPLASAPGDVQALRDLLDTLLGADQAGKYLLFPGGKAIFLRKGDLMGFPGGRLMGLTFRQRPMLAAVRQSPDHRKQRRHQQATKGRHPQGPKAGKQQGDGRHHDGGRQAAHRPPHGGPQGRVLSIRGKGQEGNGKEDHIKPAAKIHQGHIAMIQGVPQEGGEQDGEQLHEQGADGQEPALLPIRHEACQDQPQAIKQPHRPKERHLAAGVHTDHDAVVEAEQDGEQRSRHDQAGGMAAVGLRPGGVGGPKLLHGPVGEKHQQADAQADAHHKGDGHILCQTLHQILQ